MRIPRLMMMGMLGGGAAPSAPTEVSDLAATAVTNGTIVLTWTLPAGASAVLIRYSVDQAAAPSAVDLGIRLGVYTGAVAVFTGCTYGASYKFAAWSYSNGLYSSASDTATVAGPLNPDAYSSALKLWLDARQETAYADGGTVTTPQDFAAGGFGLTQGTAGNRPIWRNAANGINGMASFRFAIDLDATARCWIAAQTSVNLDTQGAGNGLTVAAIITTEGDAVGDKTLVSQWANSGSGLRRWRISQSTGANVVTLGLSTDGSTVTGAASHTGTEGTGPFSVVSIYKEDTGAYTYTGGAGLDDTDLTIGGALAATNTTACLRVGNGRSTASDPWYGEATLILGYSEPISATAAEILDADLAAMAGV